ARSVVETVGGRRKEVLGFRARDRIAGRCGAGTRRRGMREAVVVASSRTALAKSYRGSFNMTRPEDLAAHCIRDVLRKTAQLDPAEIGDVILGCAQPHGPQGSNVARISSVLAGLPVSVAATTVNRF